MAKMTSTILVVASGVTIERVGHDLLAYDGETLTRLSGSAAVVAALVDGFRSESQIVEEVSVSVGRPTPDVLPEVSSIVGQLVEKGLVTLESIPGPRDFRSPDHVGWCEDGERVVLLDLRNGERHSLDPAGAHAWKLLVTLGSTTGALEHLSTSYPDAPEIASDLAQFAADLVEHGLMQRA